jgi:hypothetical protein
LFDPVSPTRYKSRSEASRQALSRVPGRGLQSVWEEFGRPTVVSCGAGDVWRDLGSLVLCAAAVRAARMEVCEGGGPDDCHRRSPCRIPAAKPLQPEVRAVSGSDRPWPRGAAANGRARRGVSICQRDEREENPDHHRARVRMDTAKRCPEGGPVPQVRREGQRYRCRSPLSGLAEWRRTATGSSVAGGPPPWPRSGCGVVVEHRTGTQAPQVVMVARAGHAQCGQEVPNVPGAKGPDHDLRLRRLGASLPRLCSAVLAHSARVTRTGRAAVSARTAGARTSPPRPASAAGNPAAGRLRTCRAGRRRRARSR